MPRKPTMPMPNYAHHTFDGGGIALWHITETADELYALLGTTKYDTQLAEKKNDARRAEWLAVRLLIKELFGPDAEVVYHPTGRPYLKESSSCKLSKMQICVAMSYPVCWFTCPACFVTLIQVDVLLCTFQYHVECSSTVSNSTPSISTRKCPPLLTQCFCPARSPVVMVGSLGSRSRGCI